MTERPKRRFCNRLTTCTVVQPIADQQESNILFREYRRTGPYIVEKILQNENYIVRKLNSNKTQILHRIRLRK